MNNKFSKNTSNLKTIYIKKLILMIIFTISQIKRSLTQSCPLNALPDYLKNSCFCPQNTFLFKGLDNQINCLGNSFFFK